MRASRAHLARGRDYNGPASVIQRDGGLGAGRIAARLSRGRLRFESQKNRMATEQPASDVIIIGGGVIGLAAARRLAGEGLRVTVLDRGLCGRESSWAGAGVVQSGSWHRKDPLVALQRESVRMYPAFASELHEYTRIDPQFVPCGSFEVLFTEQQYSMAASEVGAAEAHRATYGRAVLELLAPEAARGAEPALTAELRGVLSCPITCQVRNPMLLEALRADCLARQVRIHEQCAVHGLRRDGDRVIGVRSDLGDLDAGHVVLAAGAWSSLLDARLAELMPVYPVRGQVIVLETRPRLFTRVIERGRCYLVPRLDGRVLVGATEEHESGYEKRNTARGVAALLDLAVQLVPALADATIVRTWSGLRPGTPDRGPYIGPVPGMAGLIAATGHFRSGLTLAPVTARIVTDLIVHGVTDRDLARVAPGRAITPGKPPRSFPASR